MIRVSVLYANEAGKKFDHRYYAKNHMSLVQQRLKSAGLIRVEIDKGLAGGQPGASAPFVAAVHLFFNSVEDFQKGMDAHGKEILGDVPNYTNIQPQVQISEMVS
jgi:uncharacterized protein (TIGR02118 family)